MVSIKKGDSKALLFRLAKATVNKTFYSSLAAITFPILTPTSASLGEADVGDVRVMVGERRREARHDAWTIDHGRHDRVGGHP